MLNTMRTAPEPQSTHLVKKLSTKETMLTPAKRPSITREVWIEGQ